MKIDKTFLVVPLFCLIFLWQMVIDNKAPLASESISYVPIRQWVETTQESSDDFPHWFPNLFSGMQTYGGYIYTPGDPTRSILNLLFFNRDIKIWFYLTLGGLGLFYFLRQLNVSIMASVFSGVVFCLTPYAFGLINAGHTNKIYAMAFIPWVLMGAFQVE